MEVYEIKIFAEYLINNIVLNYLLPVFYNLAIYIKIYFPTYIINCIFYNII